MDATTALNRSDELVGGLIAGLRPDQADQPTPCDEWNVHDLISHMCSGSQMIAGALQGQAPPEETPDFLANGPAAGWAEAIAALRAAGTPEALAATHQLPFGEMPGEMALSVIVADQVTHGWDLARATGQEMEIDDELAEWADGVWQMVVPAEGRTGDGFKPAVPLSAEAGAVDRLVAYTGRQP